MDRMKKEYTDYTTTLSAFATEAHRKLSEPLEVSLINVKLLIQDLEVRTFWIKKWKHTVKIKASQLLKSSKKLFFYLKNHFDGSTCLLTFTENKLEF